jgi:hypothetical protein
MRRIRLFMLILLLGFIPIMLVASFLTGVGDSFVIGFSLAVLILGMIVIFYLDITGGWK